MKPRLILNTIRSKSILFFFGTAFILYSTFPPQAWAMAKTPPKEEVEQIQEIQPLPTFSLQDCYQLALKRSETVAIQKEEIEIAKADFLKAASEALGDVDLVMTDTKQESPEAGSSTSSSGVQNTFNAADRREVKFIVTQPLFQGFKTLGGLMGAGGLRKQRKHEWIRAEELLFLDVSRAFYQFFQYKKNVEILEEMKLLFEERVSELSEREKIGRSRTSEVVTAKAKMKNIEAELAQSRGTLAIAHHILEFLIGIPITIEQLNDIALPEEASTELNRYLTNVDRRSDVMAAKQAMKVARKNLLVAQSALWPTIDLEHNRYTRRDGFQSNIDWDLLFKIDVPLFRGGGTAGKIKEAISNWKKAKFSYSLAKRKAELDVKETYQTWISSLEQYHALEESVASAEENFRLQKDDYAHNLVGNLEVLEALEELHQTSREANQVQHEMKENYWNLQIATGNCCSVSPLQNTPAQSKTP